MSVNEENFTLSGGGKISGIVEVAKADEYRLAYDFGNGQISSEGLLYTLPVKRPQTISENPMVGYTTNSNASVKYAFGTIRLPITGAANLKSISITSLDAKYALSGDFRIPMRFLDVPQVEFASNSSSAVEISFDKGLQLDLSKPSYIEFLVPQANYPGFNIILTDNDSKVMTCKLESTISVLRGEVVTAPEIRYEPQGDVVSFTCSLEQDALGQASLWPEGAMINVNGNLLSISDGAGTGRGTFGPFPVADSYVAVTPLGAFADYSSSVATIAIPSSVKYDSPMMTVNPLVASSSDNTLTFKYVSGILAVRISGENIISKAVLSSSAKAICGKAKVTFTGSEIEDVFVMNDSSHEETVDCGSGVSTSGGKIFYFTLPQGDYKDLKLTLTNVRRQMAVFELPAVSIARNAKTTVPETVEWSPSVDDPGNLSAMGWANCYMISEAGTYSFETRMVDGNKVENISSADWLWAQDLASPGANTLISDISYKDGKITFKATGKEGNALIAAFDSDGNIVWSWHIWITDTPEDFNYKNRSDKNPDLGYYAMDRNLGAVSAEIGGGEATFGLFYQWGRKDPFVAGSKVEYDTDSDGNKTMYPMRNGAATACNIKYPQAKWIAEEGDAKTGTKAYAIAHPMLFLAANTTSGDNNWLAKGIGEFLTDGDPHNGLWQPFTKTIYDPCPPGYMNPRNGMWRVLESTTDVVWHDAPSYGAVYTTPGGQQTWFPAQGYRSAHPQDRGALMNVGVEHSIIQLWTSELQVSYPSCRAYSFYMDSVLTNASAQDDAWGYGLNVRCVKVYDN
ncbi:MAG: hypothetical protein ACI3Z0_04965 [Candidatus Cryptobacteroides sp.]